MICILEPKSDQALSGTILFNQALAAASHGKIEVLEVDADELEGYAGAEIVLLDSAWLYAPEARHLEKSASHGFLVHSLPDAKKDWLALFQVCDHLVATSKPIMNRLETALPDQRITLCEPGVDTRLRSLLPQPREHDLLRLITVANIMPRKGFREAVDFLEAIEAKGLLWHWYIVGEPSADRGFNGLSEIDETYFDELTGILSEYGWEDEVSFVGPMTMEQQIRLYLNMDVAFFPSREETFGHTLLEAAQLGLPVLTTKVGIAEELFDDDREALLVPAPLSVQSVPLGLAFLQRYAGLDKNVRVKRDHPLLSRSWGRAAEELLKAVRPIN
ncbi:MAG: glycosyltransferase [Chitinophagaceae bacterium]|nr:glycosyltransferase [Oligoflexus sp.]